MRAGIFIAFFLAALASTAAFAAPPRIVGIAFVDSSVTSMGSRAKLPANAVVYPPGSRIGGTTGCPTDQYGTTGLIVAVIDYDGRPTAASLALVRHPPGVHDAPYYLDLNPGRTLQYLGPIRANGDYAMELTSSFSGPMADKTTVAFTLARSCG